MADSFHAMQETIDTVIEEIATLILAVQESKLDARSRAEAFCGDWQELLMGVDRTIEACAEPLHVTATYLERIAQGDIPDHMTKEYQGDFNTIIQNMNRLIDAMNKVT